MRIEGPEERRNTRLPLMPPSANYAPHSARALDLQILKEKTGAVCMPMPKLDRAPSRPAALVRTIDGFTETDVGPRSEGASTQPARYLTDDSTQIRYRFKLNPANRPRNTFSEVVMPWILVHAYGFDHVPLPLLVVDDDNRLGLGAGAIWVASPLIDGFKDVGPFLAESGADQVEPHARDAYLAHLRDYNDAHRAAQRLRESPAIAALLARFPKGGFDRLHLSAHRTLQPLREQSRKSLRSLDRMLELLPDEFGRALSQAFYLGELVGNWDLLNHERANTGIVTDGDGVHAPTVDWGNTGPAAGFGGALKRDSLRAANQPARIEDPYARIPDALTPRGYMQDFVQQQDLSYETVSPTFGVLNGLPRAAVMGGLQRATIEQERDLEPASITRHSAPDAALAIAWHLSLIPTARIERVIEHIFMSGTDEKLPAAVRQLFSQETTGYGNAAAFATAQVTRTKALLARAKQGRQLERWAQKHPERAAEIAQRVARALRGEPKDPRDALRA